MPFTNTHVKQHRSQQWQRFWPKPFVIVIAIIQMLLTFIIFGLEVWSALINRKYSFFFIGFISSVFFTITWISTFILVCCNRKSRGCAIHALIEHILSIIALIILISFDAAFIHNPLTCLWSKYLCKIDSLNITWSNLWFYYNSTIQKIKLTAIKIQLSCAVVMLVTSIVFIGPFIYMCVKARATKKTQHPRQRIELVRRPLSRPLPSKSVASTKQNVWTSSSPNNFRHV